MKQQFPHIIDCTLRDGGYYNNWNFSRNLVEDYLNSLNSLGISFIEMGFRSFQSKDFKGPNWYTTDSYIKSFKIPRKIKIGVMVNAYELITHPLGIKMKDSFSCFMRTCMVFMKAVKSRSTG